MRKLRKPQIVLFRVALIVKLPEQNLLVIFRVDDNHPRVIVRQFPRLQSVFTSSGIHAHVSARIRITLDFALAVSAIVHHMEQRLYPEIMRFEHVFNRPDLFPRPAFESFAFVLRKRQIRHILILKQPEIVHPVESKNTRRRKRILRI